MTPKEKRTVRLGVIGVAIYLAVFGVYQIRRVCAQKRVEYDQLAAEAKDLKAEIKHYDDKIAVVKKLMENYHMDPAKLKRATVAAEASSAIQKAAMSSGFQIGPIRESPTRASSKELATIQFEGGGQVKSAVGLLNRLETLGYPLIIDSVQLTPDPMRPGQMKLKLSVVILDFDQWKEEATPHA
jgi:hypothetical protein